MALRKNAPGSGVRARVRRSTSVACAWKSGATGELRVQSVVWGKRLLGRKHRVTTLRQFVRPAARNA